MGEREERGEEKKRKKKKRGKGWWGAGQLDLTNLNLTCGIVPRHQWPFLKKKKKKIPFHSMHNLRKLCMRYVHQILIMLL